MAFLNFIDVSKYQGDINWVAVRAAGVLGAIIKISGGDAGLYYDTKANQNYYAAKAAGLMVGGYHFAGHTDPVAEANFFVAGMKPFEEGDVFVLDYDSDTGDAVAWVNSFVNRVHELTGIWCIVYVNGSTRNSHDWGPVAANCAFWIAWYGKDPNGDLPVNGIYVMHQYTSSGQVPGVSGNVDEDAVFMSPEQFEKYGYHAAVSPVTLPIPVIPDPAPAPTTTPPAEPAPVEITPIPVEPPAAVITPPEVLPGMVNNVPSSPVASPEQVAAWQNPAIKHWYGFLLELIQLIKSLIKRKK